MADIPISDIAYNRFLTEERLMGSRCRRCRERYVPPRPLCVKCFSPELDWEEVAGRGRLVAFTCIAVAPPFMITQGYGRKRPYVSGVVDLDGGGRVDARIEGVNPARPETITIGMSVRARYLHRRDSEPPETYLAFEPA